MKNSILLLVMCLSILGFSQNENKSTIKVKTNLINSAFNVPHLNIECSKPGKTPTVFYFGYKIKTPFVKYVMNPNYFRFQEEGAVLGFGKRWYDCDSQKYWEMLGKAKVLYAFKANMESGVEIFKTYKDYEVNDYQLGIQITRGFQKTKGNVVHDFYLGLGTGLSYLTATNVEKEGGLKTFSKTTGFSLLPSFHLGWNIGVEKEILKIKQRPSRLVGAVGFEGCLG